MNIKEAKKRLTIKRYLTISGVNVPNELSTKSLVILAKTVRKKQIGWPLTSGKIDALAREDHLLLQLIRMKQMFGLNSSIYVVDYGRMRTVADLVKAGLINKKYAVIDNSIHRLELIKYNS